MRVEIPAFIIFRFLVSVCIQRAFSSSVNVEPAHGFCGYPHLSNPLERPLQECSLTQDPVDCGRTPYFAQFGCEWNEANGQCSSAAFRAGLPQDNCNLVSNTDHDSCVRSFHLGFPNCKWIEIPPTPSPSKTPSASPTWRPTGRPVTESPTRRNAPPTTRTPTGRPTTLAPSPRPTLMPTIHPTFDPTPWPTPSPSKSSDERIGYCGFPSTPFPKLKPYQLCSTSPTKHECDNDLYIEQAFCDWYDNECHPPRGFVGQPFFCTGKSTSESCEAISYPGLRPCVWYQLIEAPSTTTSPPSRSPINHDSPSRAPSSLKDEEAGSMGHLAPSPATGGLPSVAPTTSSGLFVFPTQPTTPNLRTTLPPSSPPTEAEPTFETVVMIDASDDVINRGMDGDGDENQKKRLGWDFTIYMGSACFVLVVAAIVYQVYPWNGKTTKDKPSSKREATWDSDADDEFMSDSDADDNDITNCYSDDETVEAGNVSSTSSSSLSSSTSTGAVILDPRPYSATAHHAPESRDDEDEEQHVNRGIQNDGALERDFVDIAIGYL